MQAAVKFNIFTEQAFDDLLLTSLQNPQQNYAVFKHSNRCSISSMALNRMEQTKFFESKEVPFYFLDLITYRNISNYIAQKCHVEHESPQLLLIKNGNCYAYTSHSDIRESWLQENCIM